MLDDFLWIFCTVLLFALGAARGVTRAQCPPNEYVEGVRRDGSTWCAKTPTDNQDCSGTRACHGAPPRYTTPIKIWHCTGGSQPIVIDSRTIGCQHNK